jgi:predicted nuclease of predicted toxin-antitoxin system
MKLKLDENLPGSVVGDLAALGHDVDSVADEGLQGRPDSDVFAAAQRNERFLITQDLDFSDVRVFAPGSHHGLLLLRLMRPGRLALRHRLHTLFRDEDVESWSGCFVVATEQKLRIRRPGGI